METLSNVLGGAQKISLTPSERAVKNYFDANETKKSAEKNVKKFKKDIEEHFSPGDKQDLKRIGLEINWSETEKSVIDQEKLLTKVKQLGLTDCIKTIEMVDEDALSIKILDGELDPQELAGCNKVTKSARLYVKRIK